MTPEQIRLLLDASDALQDACLFRYERFTEHSCADRSTWTPEQRCRYGSDLDYELSLKLVELANSANIVNS